MYTLQEQATALTELQTSIAAKIIAMAEAQRLPVGSPIRESVLARQMSVSRTPVRAALDYLVSLGAVEHVPRRGYVLSATPGSLPRLEAPPAKTASQRIYEQIIEEHFRGDLPEKVSEAELLRRFDTDRSTLLEALARLSVEGIVRHSPGYGWQFEALLRTREADQESYRFRLIVEPAGLLEPTFRAEPEALRTLRDEQNSMIDRLRSRRPPTVSEVFDANAHFHETLADSSGNRFIKLAVEQQSRLRRLLEYRNYLDPDRVALSCREHVEILEALLSADREGAAKLMHRHVASALQIAPAFGGQRTTDPAEGKVDR